MTVVARTPDGWLTRDARQGETAVVTEPALSLDVDALYAIVAGKV